MKIDDFIASAQDFIAQSLHGHIKNFTRNGQCSGCGECCSNLLPLAKSEIENIKLYIREHHIKALPLVRNKNIYIGLCPFLDENRRCMIYDVRPFICKAFKCNRNAPKQKYIKIFLLEKRDLLDVRDTFFQEVAVHV